MVVCNGVFVHVLRLEDKIKILKRIESLLVSDGVFVFSHTSAAAHFKSTNYNVKGYCSWISIDEMLRLIHDNTNLKVIDISPTYYHWRFRPQPFLYKLLRLAMPMPFVPGLMRLVDMLYSNRKFSLEESDAFYIKLVK